MGILIFLMILPSFNTSAASEKVSLQLAWKHQFQFAGYYAALHKGYYRQAGLEVKIIEGGKGKFAREEVLKDRSQYGVAGSELILHRKDGDPFVVLAPIFQHSASILLSRKDSGISNLQDMITKRVMMLPENKDADILVAFLNEGIALDQIRRLDQTYNLNDLIEGRTDVVSAYSTNEPWSLLQKNIEPVIISPQTYGVDFYSDCLFTTQSEVEDHQQRVKSFLEASILGWEYAMDHPEEIIDLLLTDYGVKKKRDHLLYEAEGIRKIMMPDLVQIGHMNPGRWAHIKTTYAKLGLIDVDFSLEGFLYDPRPEFDYIWLRKVIFATISIIVILGIGALALLFFNRKLTLEIGERKRAEVKLRNSERLHTEAQRVSKIGHWALDSPSGVPLWSEEIFHIFGLDPEKDEPSFMAHKDIIYNADWDLLNSSIQDLSLKGIPFDIEFRILRSNGQMGWMHSIGSVDKSEHGSVHRMFGTAQDVTERKQVEEALKKSEKKYQTIMESMKEPLYINSLEFSVEYMNPAMIKRTGHDATGEKCFKAIHDLDERCPWCHYEDVMDDNTYELDAVSPKDNHSFHISVTPIVNNDGSISSLNVFRDVSEFKEMEAQVQQSQKMESIGTLAGGIAHDFNNILFPIMGHSEMLLEDVPEDNPIRSSLDQIYTSAMRASELVKQILTFSRQETGELKLMKIQPIIKEVLKLIRSTIPTTIEIKQDISPACDVIKADPTQIHQIVMNLTTNAYHAMEETGGELKVGLKQMELGTCDLINPGMTPGQYACLTVADTGTGIDKELTQKIFDPFFTTKSIGKGTGLGLSVVHGIVEGIGGGARVYSEPGIGTQFYVYFPIEKGSFVKHSIQTHETIQGGIENILLIDDEEAILSMEKQMLERLGYQVTSRISSIEALEAFRGSQDKFDLVITDMAMPNMSGDKLSAELIKIRSDIPVLLCTGFSETMSEEKASSIGIKGFLFKPIVMKDLAQKIREVLDKNKV